jgi:hypothetical protein
MLLHPYIWNELLTDENVIPDAVRKHCCPLLTVYGTLLPGFSSALDEITPYPQCILCGNPYYIMNKETCSVRHN